MNTKKRKGPLIIIADPHINNADIAKLTADMRKIEIITMQEVLESDIKRTSMDEMITLTLTSRKCDPPPELNKRKLNPWDKRKGYKKYF